MTTAPQMPPITTHSSDNFILLRSSAFPFSVDEYHLVHKRRRTANRSSDEDQTPSHIPCKCPLTSSWDSRSETHRAVISGLRSGQDVRIRVSLRFPSEVVETDTSTPPSQVIIHAATLANIQPEASLAYISADHFSEMTVEERLTWISQQPSDWMVGLVSWSKRKETLALLTNLYYDALFTLPCSGTSAHILSIPNGAQRYAIDLCKVPTATWLHAKKMRQLVGGQPSSDKEPPSAATATSTRCPRVRIAVNRNFADTMRRAKAHHEKANAGTWISKELIDALELLLVAGNQHGVKMCAVELWGTDEGSGSPTELLSACLGFAIGCVYHDFTMFTCVRSEASYGTCLTKLLGAALQECGYTMWYWGFKVGYMTMFEGKYAAALIPREDFYATWVRERSELPLWPIDEYLNGNRNPLFPPSLCEALKR